MEKFNEVYKLVGNTPMIKYKPNIYCKFEGYNPTGSIKDRIVFYIIFKALENNELNIGQTIIETSSGNTGISVAFVSSLLGNPCKIIMPKDMSLERQKLIKHFGAELILVDEGDFKGGIELRDKLAKENNYFNINQFLNKLNIECHYNTTSREILDNFRLYKQGLPDVLISGTGTGGTIMGVGKRLKDLNPNLKIVAVEPAESPVMSGGKPGLHKIQGIGDGSKFLADLDFIDEIIIVKSQDAIDKAKLLSKEGYYVGVSAAANILAAEEYSLKHPSSKIVTFMCDRGDRYLSMF